MIRAAIIGASGYTGAELVRWLAVHPEIESLTLASRSFDRESMEEIYPGLAGCAPFTCVVSDDEAISASEVVFIALPHGHAVPIAAAALNAGKKVIDLGADFRIQAAGVYRHWYGLEHGAPELLGEAVYGLPELYREKIAAARLVANPGCYPTSVILGLAPLLHSGLVDLSGIIADSKSGVSGAGKTPSTTTHFVECNENINPYGVSGHRHRPEIEQELGMLAGHEVSITFTPHLLPVTRGILSTMYARLFSDTGEERLRQIYRDFYEHAPFVRLLPEGKWPHTRWVYGSNYCDIGLWVDTRNRVVTVMSAIDNLGKGASGQAVQNMNLMFGMPETAGIKGPGVCL